MCIPSLQAISKGTRPSGSFPRLKVNFFGSISSQTQNLFRQTLTKYHCNQSYSHSCFSNSCTTKRITTETDMDADPPSPEDGDGGGLADFFRQTWQLLSTYTQVQWRARTYEVTFAERRDFFYSNACSGSLCVVPLYHQEFIFAFECTVTCHSGKITTQRCCQQICGITSTSSMRWYVTLRLPAA